MAIKSSERSLTPLSFPLLQPAMDERQFRRLLHHFPIVRSRNYCAGSERESGSRSAKDEITNGQNAWNEMDKKDDIEKNDDEEPFWEKLRLAAERKVGPLEAERFCTAFQRVHKKLVYEELSSDAARKFVGLVAKEIDMVD